MTKKMPSTWSLIRPYWFSEEKWRACGLLAIVITASLGQVFINVLVNFWSANFYDALQKKNWPVFVHQLEYFSVLAFSFIGVATAQIYFRQMLEIRWRRWITHNFISAWLKDHAFYRIQRDHLADNPDQRIADDLKDMVSTTLALSLDLLSNVVTLISFTSILWSLSGPLSFLMFNRQVTIPGYMVWVAIAYAFAGSLFTQLYARRLSTISYQQQRYEADFRYLLVRVRENAEQIALYHGAEAEQDNLTTSFGRIRENWRLIMTYTKRLTLVTNSYTQLAVIFPMIVAAPRYFAGALTFGVLIQLANGFGQVSSSLSWFINNYSSLATWRATINRLREVQGAFEAPEKNGIVFTASAAAGLATSGLALALPDGRRLTDIGSWQIQPGSRWLVRGPSGCGKSTLMRTMAGLWPFGEGTVERPISGRQLFLPQQSYLPIGTLKAALCYPSATDAFTDEECRAALQACRLPLKQQLDDRADWSHVLSPGEQQRLAAARALLQKPDYLFLDEATSSLDGPTERAVYEALLAHLPDTAFVSVAHGEELVSLHGSVFNLQAAPAR